MAKLDKNWSGSIISATLREQDLIPAFEGVLDIAGEEYERPSSVDKLLLGQSLTDDEAEEVAFYLNETLFDMLDEIAPEGTCFGSHPGDGADFGFWEEDVEKDDDETPQPEDCRPTSTPETNMTDETEPIRRKRLAEINAEPGSREALEAQYGKVWTTDELAEEFQVIGFMAPLCVVKRRSDGMKGSVEFQHQPRYFFNFEPHDGK
jgi:hypothetical protein